LDTEIRS